MATAQTNEYIRYQPDEPPPPLTSLGHGFQSVMGRLTGMAASTAIIVQASGQPDAYLSWVFFVSLVVCGLGTICLTFQVWRFGSGYPLGVSNGSAYIAVCISALAAGGPAMLSSLIIVSALIQFVLVSRLSMLRRIITPVVTGAVLMLLAATVMSVLLSKLSITPEGVPQVAAPAIAVVTLAIIMAVRLFGPSAWQQWGPLVGILAGCAVAAPFGLFDVQPFLEAPWVGIPLNTRPGFDFGLGAEFWALLPGFVIVNLAVTIYGISDIVAIQQVAWRRPRATDFRVIQGALNVVVLTNLATAVLGALPNTVPPANSARVILTGVAARSIGVYGGGILIAVALLPKLIALITAIPGSVFGAYVIVMLSVLFVQGMRLVVREGIDPRKAVVVGVSFWLGVGFQNHLIFPDLLSGTWETLLSNGLTVGSITLIVFTLLLEITGPRRRRLRVEFDISALPRIDAFLQEFASKAGWNEASANRLRSAGEETLSSLLPQDAGQASGGRQVLVINARQAEGKIELEFVATSEKENLEDRLAYLSEHPEIEGDRDLSFRLLRHYASSVRHRKYHHIDIITVTVEVSR